MRLRILAGAVTALAAFGLGAMKAPVAVPLVVISIDGLRPEDVLAADREGLEIPNLRRLVREGAYASGVRGVLPTVTYPSHTTIVTGVSPARHGILANEPFEATGRHERGWYWYAEDIRVPTLWDAARGAGLTTGNVDWPVTVGADITYNVVQYWRAPEGDHGKLLHALSTRGLMAEAEASLGPYPDGYAGSVDEDVQRARFNAYILEHKRPRLHFCYFSGLDDAEHAEGPGSPRARQALERIDGLVGLVRGAAERSGNGRASIAVVSDHGFVATTRELNLNAALVRAGLIRLDGGGQVVTWRAFAWTTGGAAAVVLRDPADARARRRVASLLDRLAARPDSGIERVLHEAAIGATGGFPGAAFVVCVRPGIRLGETLTGDVTTAGWPAGSHGFDPWHPEMDAMFVITGPGVAAGPLGRIDMRDVAPTLAGRLGIPFATAEGRDLLRPTSTSASSH